MLYVEEMKIPSGSRVLATEYLPGQYDQRADSIAKSIQIFTSGEEPKVKVAKMIIFEGSIRDDEFANIKNYLINPVESKEASLKKPETLKTKIGSPEDVQTIDSFTKMSEAELESFMKEIGFAMSFEDLKFCQSYFKDVEKEILFSQK